MAYDKVIDSAKLDGALTATANAIREKTGETAQIAWDSESGFASAVSGIPSGSQVASGSFTTPTNSLNIDETPYSVTGVGFKPTRVILYVYLANNAASFSTSNLHYIDWSSSTKCAAVFANNSVKGVTSSISVTFDSDGFTLSSTSTSYDLATGKTYNWIAIG